MIHSRITELLNIEFPLIMAPMFLVSNEAMLKSGIENGIMAVFPSLNYRKEGELDALIHRLNDFRQIYRGNFGVNLIVQKTNPYLKKHLEICVSQKVPFYITSLGNPREVIKAAHAYGAKVFCDVTNLKHAQTCFSEGCDGFIAVGEGAGGHAGPNPLQVLIPALNTQFPGVPVVAAGGITNGSALLSTMILGADGASVGTRFIVSKECGVSDDYKQAIMNAGMDDIVMTEKLSGTPCTIINTETAQKLGYTQNWFERWMSRNPKTKKWFKTFIQIRGMKKLEASLLPNNYLRLWCAGKSAQLIREELSCQDIIISIKQQYQQKLKEINS